MRFFPTSPVSSKPPAWFYAATWARETSARLWMLLAGTFPLFLGGVTDSARIWFAALASFSLLLWTSAQLIRFRAFSFRPALGWLVAGVLLLGWTAALNPSFIFLGPNQGFLPLSHWSWLPSSVDAITSRTAMIRWTLMLGLLCMTADLCSNARRRFQMRIALLSGGLILLLIALGQRLTESTSILGSGVGVEQPFFGTFIYPGSAGAYFNALLPAYCILLYDRRIQRWIGFVGVLLTGVALFWNTSRISSVVGLLETLVLTGVLMRSSEGPLEGVPPHQTSPAGARSQKRTWAVGLLSLAFLSVAVFQVHPLFEKWRMLPQQWTLSNPRVEAARVSFKITRDAGFWGFGPGTFQAVFPQYTAGASKSIAGVWKHAHCDYLEFWIEWGCVGGLFWLCLLLGGVFEALLLKVPPSMATLSRSRSDFREKACGVAALSALGLHAIADFPLQNPSVLLVAFFWLGCAWSGHKSKKSQVQKALKQEIPTQAQMTLSAAKESERLPQRTQASAVGGEHEITTLPDAPGCICNAAASHACSKSNTAQTTGFSVPSLRPVSRSV